MGSPVGAEIGEVQYYLLRWRRLQRSRLQVRDGILARSGRMQHRILGNVAGALMRGLLL